MQTPAVAARSFFVFVVALGPAHAQQNPDLSQARIYDVRDVVRRTAIHLPATAIDASFVPVVHDTGDDAQAAMELAELANVIRMATAPEYWEREGVELRPEDTGLMSVACDETMHANVRDVLAKLRRLLFEPVFVEVHELPGSALGKHGSVLSAEAADALLAQVGAHRLHAGRTDPRTPLLLESKRIRNRIAGMRMMVAQNASAPDLALATENHGTSWTVRAAPTIGDALLVTVSGSDRSIEAGPVRELPTGGDGQVATLELPVTRIATCHASSYLRPGEAMLVGSDAPGGALLCVRVRRSGPPAPRQIGAVTVYPVESLVRGPVRPNDLPVPYEEGTLFGDPGREPMPAVFDDGRLMDWLRSQVEPETWDGSPNSMFHEGGMLFVSAPESTQKAIAEQLQSLQNVDLRQFTLEVRFGEVPAEVAKTLAVADAAQLADALPQRCVSTVSASRSTRHSATWHTPYVKGYDVVIASGSAATTPELGSVAKGFLLSGEVAPMDNGTVMLDLRVSMLSHAPEASRFSLREPRFGQVDKIDVRENKLRGATVVVSGEWTILQLSPAEGGQGHVAVVARVRAP